MQSIQDAVGHFQGARLLEESMGQISECWSQMEQAQLAQRSAEERLRLVEEKLNTEVELMRQLQERVETMVMERVETLVLQRLEEMVTNAVEAKVQEKFEHVQQNSQEHNGNQEIVEPSCSTKMEETINNCDQKDIHNRLTLLESSIQKAVEVMFPRVELLLSQMEMKSGLTCAVKSSLNQPSLKTTAKSIQASHQTTSQSSSATAEVGSSPQLRNLFKKPSKTYAAEYLIEAVKNRKAKLVKKILDTGVNINACDFKRNSGLHWAIINGPKSTVSLFLDRGADVNRKNKDGWTPLHFAGRRGDVTFITQLLNAGAAIESRTSMCKTPLHIAAQHGCKKAVQVLIREGARVNVRNAEGRTPFDLTTSYSIRQLLQF